jgi:hypothetical protein
MPILLSADSIQKYQLIPFSQAETEKRKAATEKKDAIRKSNNT